MITSTGNQQIKNLAALIKKPRERRAGNAFVVEGMKMFSEAPGEWIKGIYVSESYLSDASHRKLLEGRNYEVVSDRVFSAVSDTQTPQGILAVVRIPAYELKDLLRGSETHLLVLENIQDPGNLGTMFRTGEGAGVTGIIMNRTTVDLFNPKTIRSTMGSIYRMPYFIAGDLAGVLEELKGQGVRFFAAHLRGERLYDEEDYQNPCGFLIGNEGSGLTDEISALASKIRIPMEGHLESLNAAVAASLLMYECNRQRRCSGKVSGNGGIV